MPDFVKITDVEQTFVLQMLRPNLTLLNELNR